MEYIMGHQHAALQSASFKIDCNKCNMKNLADHRADIEDDVKFKNIGNIVGMDDVKFENIGNVEAKVDIAKYIRNVDEEQFANIREFEIEVDFKNQEFSGKEISILDMLLDMLI